MSSLLEAVNELWLSTDSTPLRFPITYSTAAFPNIAILISPTHIKKLTPVKMALGLVQTVASIAGAKQDHWPGGIITTMADVPSAQTLGLFNIWDDTLPRNALLSLNRRSAKATTLSFANSSITTTTGLGIAGNGTCATTCSSLTDNPPSPIADVDWLFVFTSVVLRVFPHSSSESVAAQFHRPGEKSWIAVTAKKQIRCRVLFSDTVFDGSAPLTLAGYVEGMLAILREWARNDVWREGWGEIKLRGLTVATMQISRFKAEVGRGDGVAIA